MEKITLNKGQQQAVEYIKAWYEEHPVTDSNRMFSLIGAAGTGKTTVTKEILESLKLSNVAISAPTHKAVKIASDVTGLQGKTLQSLLGLRPNVSLPEFNINFPVFDPLGEVSIRSYNLIIIDEASMINKDLFKFLLQETRNSNVKILFLGDSYQLPPVKEIISEVFKIEKYTFELTQLMRQSDDNPTVGLLNALKESIDTKSNLFSAVLSKPDFTKEHGFGLTSNMDNFIEHFVKSYKRGIDVKYMAWTNEAISKFNTKVREELYEEFKPLHIGESLIGYRTCQNLNEDASVVNSEEYIVEDISTIQEEKQVRFNVVKLKNPLDINLSIRIVERTPENYLIFAKQHEQLLLGAKQDRRKWPLFYKFVNNFLTMSDVYSASGKMLVQKKSIDYAYGITVHKSQGSTFDMAYVNYNNIMFNKDFIETCKLLYVAASRSKGITIFKV